MADKPHTLEFTRQDLEIIKAALETHIASLKRGRNKQEGGPLHEAYTKLLVDAQRVQDKYFFDLDQIA